MNEEKDIHYRLIANPEKLKFRRKNYIKENHLKLYLNEKFNVDTKTLNNLIKNVDNYINTIVVEDIIIESIIEDIINKL